MPRGKPKRGQFDIKIWYPGGGSSSEHTTKDLTLDEWHDAAIKSLDRHRMMVDRYYAAKKAEQGGDHA